MGEVRHIQSTMQCSSMIESIVTRWKKLYGAQAVEWYEMIKYGGKRRWGGELEGAETKFLVANLQTQLREWSDTPKWEIVDHVDLDRIRRINRDFAEAHIDRWITPLAGVVKVDERYRIDPWDVDGQRMGLYAVHSSIGQLRYIVRVTTQDELFSLFDRVEQYASNFELRELVELGYLTVADHTSWLGKAGSHSHAVVAHFRQLPDKVVYFRLDTWCSGNHWLAHEHSPKPVTPTLENVTCKKCQKAIQKRQSVQRQSV